jgi:hypothetical protein
MRAVLIYLAAKAWNQVLLHYLHYFYILCLMKCDHKWNHRTHTLVCALATTAVSLTSVLLFSWNRSPPCLYVARLARYSKAIFTYFSGCWSLSSDWVGHSQMFWSTSLRVCVCVCVCVKCVSSRTNIYFEKADKSFYSCWNIQVLSCCYANLKLRMGH